MQTRQVIRTSLLAGLVLICLPALALGLWDREPTYHGKPFSYS